LNPLAEGSCFSQVTELLVTSTRGAEQIKTVSEQGLFHMVLHCPRRPGAVKRPSRVLIKIHFVWGFCMGAQGA
jgi:hypothetical protein